MPGTPFLTVFCQFQPCRINFFLGSRAAYFHNVSRVGGHEPIMRRDDIDQLEMYIRPALYPSGDGVYKLLISAADIPHSMQAHGKLLVMYGHANHADGTGMHGHASASIHAHTHAPMHGTGRMPSIHQRHCEEPHTNTSRNIFDEGRNKARMSKHSTTS